MTNTITRKNILEKRKSNINGMGIFTNQPVTKNTEYYAIPLTIIHHTPQPRCARIADSKYVQDDAVLNWVNHSCDPNSILDIERPDPVLKAIRDIAPDEEISVDYNRTEVQGVSVECTCKAANCKGYFDRL
ncbi:MAG: SET domain-containing protein-lysine N-methyltransferase [Saprospiraceae bacterium]